MTVGVDNQASMRILFVDDEPNILQAMRRTLHGMRSEWSMEFLPSGAAALESLSAKPADVIVTDMRMPSMDGRQLLAEIKNHHPQTVRLLLSGQSDPTCIMLSVGTAHQYLAKPCDGVTLKAAIAQTQMLRKLLGSPSLAQLVGHVGLLPSAPKAFQELLACLQGPDATVADAARIIGRDVAMTANIMKLVNSAFFGARQTITRIDKAVAYIGFDKVASLVLGQGAFQTQVSISIEGFDLEQLWQHSLKTATIARVLALAEELDAVKVEEAYLAALLHDVGKVIFATRARSGAPGSNDEAVAEMETHHAEVGAYLLGLWGFPNSIVEAVAFHHLPSHSTDTGLGVSGIVHVADRLAHQHGLIGEAPAAPGIEPGFLEGLNLMDRLPQWSAAIDALEAKQTLA